MSTLARPRQLVDAFAEALNAKDANALGQLFTEDAEFVNIMGMRMRGRQGIVDGHAWAFNGPLRGRRVRFEPRGIAGRSERDETMIRRRDARVHELVDDGRAERRDRK